MLRGFTANGAGNIADRKIDWVCGLVARELSKVGLVSGDYNGCHSGLVGEDILNASWF